jgi:hypothetical protein
MYCHRYRTRSFGRCCCSSRCWGWSIHGVLLFAWLIIYTLPTMLLMPPAYLSQIHNTIPIHFSILDMMNPTSFITLLKEEHPCILCVQCAFALSIIPGYLGACCVGCSVFLFIFRICRWIALTYPTLRTYIYFSCAFVSNTIIGVYLTLYWLIILILIPSDRSGQKWHREAVWHYQELWYVVYLTSELQITMISLFVNFWAWLEYPMSLGHWITDLCDH